MTQTSSTQTVAQVAQSLEGRILRLVDCDLDFLGYILTNGDLTLEKYTELASKFSEVMCGGHEEDEEPYDYNLDSFVRFLTEKGYDVVAIDFPTYRL